MLGQVRAHDAVCEARTLEEVGINPNISMSDVFAVDGAVVVVVCFVCIPLKMSNSFVVACVVFFGGGAFDAPPGPTSVIGPSPGKGASPRSIVPAERGSTE